MKSSLVTATFVLLFSGIIFAQTQAPRVGLIGEEERVASVFMERPSVATDSLGQPHMVCDAGGDTRFMKFHKVNGAWSGGIFAVGARGGRYNASRLYVGQIEIDSRDRAWVSCKFGVKEYGTMYGQGVWLFKDVATTPTPKEQFFRFVCVYKGMGVISTDAKYPDQGIVIGTFGNYAILDAAAGQTLKTGSLNNGPGGEKVRARVASYAPRFGAVPGQVYADGIWHTAMNGYSACSSKYQNSARYKAGAGPVTWADYSTYPQQGADFSHPGMGIDLINPQLAYIGSVFNNKLCVNIWNGSQMLFPSSSLKILDFNAAYEARHGIAFAPAPTGGTFVFWSGSGRIKMTWLSPAGEAAETLDVSAGRSPAATTDRYGNLHLVYYNGGIQYRKILVASLDPLSPKGRVTDTRTPPFQWSGTGAAAYTVALALDGALLSEVTVPTNRWTPDAPLGAGFYSWSVKEGETDSTEPWSRALAFAIPPGMPTPLTPAGRSAATTPPLFHWDCDDPAATSFRIQLYRGETSLGYLSTEEGAGHSATWPTPLEPGIYQWRLRSQHLHPGTPAYSLNSDWTPTLNFQVAVPGACVITTPESLASFLPGTKTVACSWTDAEAASSYTLTVLFNGSALSTLQPLTATNYPLTRKFSPGYYTLIVQPVNTNGPGPMSPARTFIVNRNMTPGANAVLTSPLGPFAWTRSPDATRYRVRLARYDNATLKYALVLETWVAQVTRASIPWTPAYAFRSGSYRWTVTDYNDTRAGFTSTAYFKVQNWAAPAP